MEARSCSYQMIGLPNELRVVAVVANSPTPLLEPVVDKWGKPIVVDGDEPFAYFLENQGFVVAFDIRHATELIDANPIGFALPVGEGG